MRKILVFKHVAQENLGNIKPSLMAEGFRIRYVNFGRDPEAQPSLDRYQGLIVMGGHMGVYEAELFPHIKVECALIEAALEKNIPVLGICLGAQLLAHTLGSPVRKHKEREMGWCDLEMLKGATNDSLFQGFQPSEKIFQMHGDTFDIPAGAVHLAQSEVCGSQAFRYGEKTYGLQFHLEATQTMISDFLAIEKNNADLVRWGGPGLPDQIRADSQKYLPRSLALGQSAFSNFLGSFGLPPRAVKVRHSHGRDR